MNICRRGFLIATTQTAAIARSATSFAADDTDQRVFRPDGFASCFVEANGIRLHYVEAGSGPPVVLLHGWPQTSFAWRRAMRALSGRFTTIAPDLRGIGLSERPISGYDKQTIAMDIHALIGIAAGGRAHVIGHDMGGKAAYMLARLYPASVEKLVLVDCLLPGTENADALHGGAWHYGFHMAKDFPELLTRGRERDYIRAQIRAWSHRKDAVDEGAMTEYARHYATPGGMTAGFNLYRALPEDAAACAALEGAPLGMPVLAITGAYGVGSKLADALRSRVTNLTSKILPDCGHFVPEEASDAFHTEVGSFMAR